MTGGVNDLLSSERGAWCIVLLIVATGLVLIGKITGEKWLEFVGHITGLLVASKTITTAVEARSKTAKEG